MSIPTMLGFLTLVVGVPLNVFVTVRLWRLTHLNPDLPVLRERAIAASAVLLVVVSFAVIFLNNDLVPPPLPFELTKYVTRAVMLVVAVGPAAYWLWLYRPGQRDE